MTCTCPACRPDIPLDGVPPEVRVLVKLRGRGHWPIERWHSVVVLAESETAALDFLRVGDVLRCERREAETERERVVIIGIHFPEGEPAELVLARGFMATPIGVHDLRCTWRLVNHVSTTDKLATSSLWTRGGPTP